MVQLSKSTLTVGEAVNGAAHQVTVFNLKGSTPGPKVYIQANLHGAEMQGNAVIYHLLERLQQMPMRGEVTIVPQANPIGLNQKSGDYTDGRFDPGTGDNWNRGFFHDLSFLDSFVSENIDASDENIRQRFRDKLRVDLSQAMNNPFGLSTSNRLCYQLQQMALEADYVLDLHTGPKSSKHLYIPQYCQNSASYFSIPHVIIIPNGFAGAMDEACFVPWWRLSEVFAEQGRHLDVLQEAFTVELGSEEQIDLSSAADDVDGILAYLTSKNVFVSGGYTPVEMTRFGCYLNNYKTFYAPTGGLVEYLAENGSPLKAGEPLAKVLNIELYGDNDALSTLSLPMDVLPILHFASAGVVQGAELYKVFTDYFELPHYTQI